MKRRGNNEGTIFQRRDGRWTASYFDSAGKRRSIYSKSREDAGGKLLAALAKARTGEVIPDGKDTLSGYLNRWLETSVRPNVRDNTFTNYEVAVRLHITPHIGRVKLAKLQPQHLAELYIELAKTLAPKSVKSVHTTLHTALKQAVRWRIINYNPAAAVSAPRVPRKEIVALDSEQVRRLLSAASETPIHALYVLAVTTGLRQGELCGLRWVDCDLESGKLAVRQQAQRSRGEVRFSEPKTASSRRTVMLSRLAITALRQHRVQQAAERLQAGAAWKDHGLVFTSGCGSPIEKTNLHARSFKPLLAAAELPNVPFHALRHSAASLLLTRGVNVKVVQEMLGHASIKQTSDVYSHLTPAMQQTAADSMDAVLSA